MTTNNYRKIWEEANGPIPVDSNGRSFEIHHKNGDHSDNHPENLECVTIEEHYEKHFEMGDFLSCSLIAHRARQPVIRLFGELNGFYGKKHTRENMIKMVQNRLKSGDGDYFHGKPSGFKSQKNRQIVSLRMLASNPMKDPVVCAQVQSKRVETLTSFSYWHQNQFAQKISNHQDAATFVVDNIREIKARDLMTKFDLKEDFSRSIVKRFKAEYLSPQGGV